MCKTRMKPTFCRNPPSNSSGTFHSLQCVGAKRCHGYRRIPRTVSPGFLCHLTQFCAPFPDVSPTVVTTTVDKRQTYVEKNFQEGFDGGLRQNVGFILVSQTFHPSVCVRDDTNDSASCQHTARDCPGAAWGAPGTVRGSPWDRPGTAPAFLGAAPGAAPGRSWRYSYFWYDHFFNSTKF